MNKTTPHYHIWDLPKSVFPRSKGNKAKEYARDFTRLYASLYYTNDKLQSTAQISLFNIKSITKKKGYRARAKNINESVEEYVYHYENFCYRMFSIREKIFKFINEVVPIGYKENDVSPHHLTINPIIKETNLITEIRKFSGNNSLGQIIKDRNFLTHKLYYGQVVGHQMQPLNKIEGEDRIKWFKDWQKNINITANRAMKAFEELSDINHKVSEKIYAYKNKSSDN